MKNWEALIITKDSVPGLRETLFSLEKLYNLLNKTWAAIKLTTFNLREPENGLFYAKNMRLMIRNT